MTDASCTCWTTTNEGRIEDVLIDLMSWAVARPEAIDPRGASLVDIMDAWVAYVFLKAELRVWR